MVVLKISRIQKSPRLKRNPKPTRQILSELAVSSSYQNVRVLFVTLEFDENKELQNIPKTLSTLRKYL